MTDRTSRARRPGETGGSSQRAPHQLVGPALTFDLGPEIEQMRHEAAWQQGDRNARTLVKQPGLRIVLTLMKGGARLRDHRCSAGTRPARGRAARWAGDWRRSADR